MKVMELIHNLSNDWVEPSVVVTFYAFTMDGIYVLHTINEVNTRSQDGTSYMVCEIEEVE